MTTTFSPCRVYRYTLWRQFGYLAKTGVVQFIGLNPSTADEVIDDPTVRRCIGFAKSWGYGILCMTNAFAFRSTNPSALYQVESPVGVRNNEMLLDVAARARLIVLAWGKDGMHLGQHAHIVRALRERGYSLFCLGKNKDGTPKHPLYLSGDLKPIPFE